MNWCKKQHLSVTKRYEGYEVYLTVCTVTDVVFFTVISICVKPWNEKYCHSATLLKRVVEWPSHICTYLFPAVGAAVGACPAGLCCEGQGEEWDDFSLRLQWHHVHHPPSHAYPICWGKPCLGEQSVWTLIRMIPSSSLKWIKHCFK